MADLLEDIVSILDDMTGRKWSKEVDETDSDFEPTWEFKSLEDNVVVLVDLPSVDKSTVDVEVREGVLTVSGERVKGEDIMYSNRKYGKFNKNLKLGDELDLDSVEASLVDGVLSISIKKKPEAKASKIEIK